MRVDPSANPNPVSTGAADASALAGGETSGLTEPQSGLPILARQQRLASSQQRLRGRRQQRRQAQTRPAPRQPAARKDSAIAKAEQTFKARVGERAKDRNAFHQMMKQVYGGRYDEKTVENLRQRALNNDFSFLPKARFVTDATLNGNHAAYDAKSGTILLNERLQSNPQQLADYYAEEAGHHIDTLFGAGDAVGDEGELLRNVLAGNELSQSELAAIKSEDDRGVIMVDGRAVEVEFGLFKKIKKGFKKVTRGIKKGFKKVVGGVKKFAGKVWDGIKSAGKWLMTSTVGNLLITGALAALSVVTAGAGTAAMVAWEAAKQAAFAVGRSVLVQKAAGFVAKVTGSETLGRIAGLAGAAVAGGKVDFSSSGSFARTAGAVAKDIAANEAKRIVKNEVVSRIDSPFLQTVAGFAVDKGIDAGANYAYRKAVDYATSTPQETDVKDSSQIATQPKERFSLQAQAEKGLNYVSNVNVGDVAKALAPKELQRVLTVVLSKSAQDFSLGELATAVKQGLNDFRGMSANDIAAAIQDYTESLVRRAGDVDIDDVKRFAQDTLRQAGDLKAQDLVQLLGQGGDRARYSIESLANLANTSPEALTLEDLFRLATGDVAQPTRAAPVAATA